jgi:hypothetical protein
MGQRQFVRADSTEVQGEGSFVVVRKLGYAQRRKVFDFYAKSNGGKIDQGQDQKIEITTEFLDFNDQITREMLVESVVAWDWTDDDGHALPLPSADPAVIEHLTGDEVDFLAKLIQSGATPAAEKN